MPTRGKRRWTPRAPSALQRRAALIRAGVDLDRQPFDFAGAVAPMAGNLLRRRRCLRRVASPLNGGLGRPRLQPDRNPMPFDGKRLIYGGFEVILDA
jgi:hypothetical protein